MVVPPVHKSVSDQFVCICNLVFIIPLHAAWRAMAAAVGFLKPVFLNHRLSPAKVGPPSHQNAQTKEKTRGGQHPQKKGKKEGITTTTKPSCPPTAGNASWPYSSMASSEAVSCIISTSSSPPAFPGCRSVVLQAARACLAASTGGRGTSTSLPLCPLSWAGIRLRKVWALAVCAPCHGVLTPIALLNSAPLHRA